MKLNKIFSQNNFWLSLITVMAIALLLPNISFANVGSVMGNVLGTVILYVLFAPFIFLFELEMIILPIIAQFDHFTDLQGIKDGWSILRDLSNMFFIVVLLFMAFATILKMSSYGYKELLKNLIIMAILINFSKTIAGLIIDIGQVVMLTFVAAIKDVAAGNLTAAFGVDKLLSFDTSQSEGFADGTKDFSAIVLGYFLAGVMILLATVVIMAFIIMLVMRIVMLWILVVVSPIAFLANTFPATKKYFGQWLGTLFKEVMIGPVLIFFLWLSLSILQNDPVEQFKTASSVDGNNSQAADQLNNIGEIQNGALTEAGRWDNVLRYIIAITMLLGALKMTKSFGSTAGDFGVKWGQAASQKIRDTYYKGTSGAGGLRGGASRLAFGSTVDPATGESKMSLLNRGLMFTGKFVPGAKQWAMRGEGMEDKRTKVKTAFKAKLGENVRDIEAFHAAGVGRYERSEQLKAKLASGQDLDENEARELHTLAAGGVYNKDVKNKLEQKFGLVNTEKSMQYALDTHKGKEHLANMDLVELYQKDEAGIVQVAPSDTQAYRQGQILAKGFLQLKAKERDEVLSSMDKDSKEAMLQYTKTLSTEELDAIDAKKKQKAYVVKQKEKVGKDGTFEKDDHGNVIMEEVQDINEDSAHWAKAATLGKYKSGEAKTADFYAATKARAKAAAETDRGPKANFDPESADKALAKSMLGVDLVKMSPKTKLFQDISKFLTMGQMRSMSEEGNASGHLTVAVEIKCKTAMEKDPRDMSEIRRLNTNPVTKAFVPEEYRVEKKGGKDSPASTILAPGGRPAREVLKERGEGLPEKIAADEDESDDEGII